MIDWNNPTSLKVALKRLGQRYDDFAVESNLSRSSVIRLANGKNKPNWATQRKVEDALIRLEQAASNCSDCKVAKKSYVAGHKSQA